MTLSKEQIEHIAKLAQLELTEEELNKYSYELTAVLNYIDNLKKVDSKEEDEQTGYTDIYRTDEIVPSVNADEIMKQVPQKDGKYMKVPKIIG